ncbi:MAG: glycosyltransferase family 2 protein, partial [Rhodopila sp.]
MLSLATACLDVDPVRAADLFRRVAEQHDIRHAWLGLAAGLLRSSGPKAAAEPLGVALSRHAFIPDMEVLAAQIAEAPHGRGWCALASDGTVIIRGTGTQNARLSLDGLPLKRAVLPRDWSRHSRLDVNVDGEKLVGSTILIDRIRRVAGCVDSDDGGITGWAWHPADPDRPVVLTLHYPRSKERRVILADKESAEVPHAGPLARPRSFHLSREELDWAEGPVHVTGPDGQDLLGSPLDPAAQEAWHAEAAGPLARLYPADSKRPARPERPVKPVRDRLPIVLRADAPIPRQAIGAQRGVRSAAIIIPVHNGGRVAIDCLASVLAGGTDGARIVVVDDGSTEAEVVAELDHLAKIRQITLVRHARARGFPAAANAGILAAPGRDVVLLNSDTLVPPGWLGRLRDAAYSAPNIGSVTPLSNDATILSYPGGAGTNPRPDMASTRRLDALAQRANAGRVRDIPVGVGFCIYLRRDCLMATGLLRADIFAQGYGEENDFCLRARRLGWRHVAATGVFVGHHGGSSFSGTALHLRHRNARILEQMQPGHDSLVAQFLAEDPLAEDRR